MNNKIDFVKIKNNIENLEIFDFATVFKEIASTNDYAKKIACEYDSFILFAESQTAGRGRIGKTWLSDFGGCLMFSIVIRPEITDELSPFITQIVAKCIHQNLYKSLEDKHKIQIKWPNDIMLNSKKICGILTEKTTCLSKTSPIIIGVGINLYNSITEPSIAEIATTVESETGIIMDADKFILDFINSLFEEIKEFTEKNEIDQNIISYLNEYSFLKDRFVTVNEVSGTVKGVDESGNLLVENSVIRSGTVEYL